MRCVRLIYFVPHSYLAMARTKLAPRKLSCKKRWQTSTAVVVRRTMTATVEPLDTYRSGDGVKGEVIRLGVSQANTHLVYLPGNPGLIAFYREHLKRVVARLPHDVNVAVHALGLPGHDMSGLNGDATYDIDAHIAYVHSYIEDNIPKTNLVLAAHSYGAHLALAVSQQLLSQYHCTFMLLMPCVRDMARCAGALTRTLLTDPFRTISATAWIAAQLLPSRALNLLLSRTQYPSAIQTLTRYLHVNSRAALYRNICTLAQDEMKRITDVPTSPDLPRAHVLWAPDDKWCTTDTIAALENAFGDRIISEKIDVDHAFVLNHHHSEKVAATVASWLAALVRNHSPVAHP